MASAVIFSLLSVATIFAAPQYATAPAGYSVPPSGYPSPPNSYAVPPGSSPGFGSSGSGISSPGVSIGGSGIGPFGGGVGGGIAAVPIIQSSPRISQIAITSIKGCRFCVCCNQTTSIGYGAGYVVPNLPGTVGVGASSGHTTAGFGGRPACCGPSCCGDFPTGNRGQGVGTGAASFPGLQVNPIFGGLGQGVGSGAVSHPGLQINPNFGGVGQGAGSGSLPGLQVNTNFNGGGAGSGASAGNVVLRPGGWNPGQINSKPITFPISYPFGIGGQGASSPGISSGASSSGCGSPCTPAPRRCGCPCPTPAPCGPTPSYSTAPTYSPPPTATYPTPPPTTTTTPTPCTPPPTPEPCQPYPSPCRQPTPCNNPCPSPCGPCPQPCVPQPSPSVPTYSPMPPSSSISTLPPTPLTSQPVNTDYPATPPTIFVPTASSETSAFPSPVTQPPQPPVTFHPGPGGECCAVHIQGNTATFYCGCSLTSGACDTTRCSSPPVPHIPINTANYPLGGVTISCDDAIQRGYFTHSDITATCSASPHPPSGGNYPTAVPPSSSSVGAVSILSAVIALGVVVVFSL